MQDETTYLLGQAPEIAALIKAAVQLYKLIEEPALKAALIPTILANADILADIVLNPPVPIKLKSPWLTKQEIDDLLNAPAVVKINKARDETHYSDGTVKSHLPNPDENASALKNQACGLQVISPEHVIAWKGHIDNIETLLGRHRPRPREFRSPQALAEAIKWLS